jgi:2-methylisocitrate lyase-like PEP mutase family enzyme
VTPPHAADVARHGAASRRLHARGAGTVLRLPDVWDAATARAFELAGAPAAATTSAGIVWARGKPDGEAIARDDAVEAVRRIVDASERR